MSAIAGIYHTDGRPADEGLLLRMRDIVADRGPDGAGFWIQGPVGLAHRLLQTTEESRNEQQPLTNGRGLWITADGRVDNREELRNEFQSHGIWREGGHARPDVVYMLLAYELWAGEAPNHLLGDFAFAIWDERKQELFCARDQIGVKPLFYHWDGRKFLFGSQIKQILVDPEVPWDVCLPHLAGILADLISDRSQTPYEAIRRLPPGYSLRITKAGFEVKHYWQWHPDNEPLSRASLGEKAEAFRFFFQESIRARLRVSEGYRAGALLSGGLDSSSIASMVGANRLRWPEVREGAFPVFTLRFPEADPSYQMEGADWINETGYAEAVVQQYNLEQHVFEIKGWGPLENFEENLWVHESPLFTPNLAYLMHLYRVACTPRVRVLLHGEGGDNTFFIGPWCWVNELKKGNGSKFLAEWPSQQRVRRLSPTGLLRFILRSLAPEILRVPYRRLFRKRVPPWVSPRLAKALHLREKMERDIQWDFRTWGSPSYGILWWMKRGHVPLYLETQDRASTFSQAEVRYPFLDLRFLRFMATIPWEDKVGGGVKRLLLREAMKDYLPPLVRERSLKADFTPLVGPGLKKYALAKIRETFRNPHPLFHQLAVPRKIEAIYEGCFKRTNPKFSLEASTHWVSLWDLMNVDQWLKYQETFHRKIKEGTDEKQERSRFTARKVEAREKIPLRAS